MKKIKNLDFEFNLKSVIHFRNCPCVFFCNIGYGLIPTFEIGELSDDQNEFFLSRFSSSKYEDMQI